LTPKYQNRILLGKTNLSLPIIFMTKRTIF
jgi:hypothetical protein